MTISTSKPKLFSTLGQICKLIPVHLVARLARETGVEERARTFTPWSHVVTLLYAQLAHALSLNDVCDALSFVTGRLQAIRGAKAPARNTFSHANRQRDPELARHLFWSTLEHLQTLSSGFTGRQQRRYGFRFKRPIHLVDSTTITLVANCIDWARHRRRKAAAKCHVRLDWGSLLPRFVSWVHCWTGSFSRLFTLLRATLWMPKDLAGLLQRYGTADPKQHRMCAHPESVFLPGLLHHMTP